MKTIRQTVLLVLALAAVGAWLWLRWLERSYEPPYCLVEEGLFIGSSAKQPPTGTRAVVNLCGRKDSYMVEASLWEPIFEGDQEPSLAWLTRVVEFIAAQRKLGRPVYVHCLAGMNRSAAVVTAYLMVEHGWSRDQALAYLQGKRPVVQPNPELMRLLATWEQQEIDKYK